MTKKGFIFDLDGVIVDTAKYHFLAWKELANSIDIDFTEKNEFSKKIVDLRPARAQSTKELLKIFMITAVATAVIMEFNYRTFGPPIKGINLIGKYIGVQVTDNGILDNVRTVGIADWTEFFHQS